MKTILEIKNLHTKFSDKNRSITVSDNISLELKANEILGVVGESGSGKTMTALSLTGLLPDGWRTSCSRFSIDAKDINISKENELKKIRASGVSYIFQEAVSYINPLFSIGDQITETIMYNRGYAKDEAVKETYKLLEDVGLTPAAELYGRFAHQLSGGMNQRAMIALAISSHPKILIADEPTTALDVTIEYSIVKLIRRLIKELNLSVIWITHDISLIQSFAGRLAVMWKNRLNRRSTACL